MTDENSLYPLEKYLKENSSTVAQFPSGKTDYFGRYMSLKNYLDRNVWKNIGAMTSADDGGVYTDHGVDHFNKVIQYAGLLLQIENDGIKKITPYEAYLTLVAILLHDAGNVFGRRDHEKKAAKILKDAGDSVISDRFEAKIVAGLAAVHGGKVINESGQEDQDTIGTRQWPDCSSYSGVTYRPNLIAAIVRFADEICEDSSRAITYLLNTGAMKEKSEAFHHYAASICSVEIDHRDKSIIVHYEVDESCAGKKLGKLDGEVFLVEEIFSRLEKMNCERIYCMRFMSEVVQLFKIRANITLFRDTEYGPETIRELNVLLEDKGYPENSENLLAEYPDWAGGINEGEVQQ